MNRSIETLFKEHSLEEIESVKENLAVEIGKRTDQLKSIVKEKYRDIVETSDAIQSMKVSLKDIEQSLWSLDKSITEFYTRIKEPEIELSTQPKLFQEANITKPSDPILESKDKNQDANESTILGKLVDNLSEIWNYFDSGNLKHSVRLLNESLRIVDNKKDRFSDKDRKELNSIKESLTRFEDMIKNNILHKIQIAAPDQIGIIAESDDEDLYELSLKCSIEFLVNNFRRDITDISYYAQIRRYQQCSYFDSQTNEIISKSSAEIKSNSSYVQIPKYTSPELNTFLYKVCRVINTIAGFNLNRSSIVDSLNKTIECALKVYEDLIPMVSDLKSESKRKRALQLYFDLLYLRILLNQSKNTDLIESLDPKITELALQYELMLDSIELYMISSALHTNVMNLSQSTIRLHGLLIPHLQ